jgi:acetate kinase
VSRVLVVNAGSTSLKLALVDPDGDVEPLEALEDVPDDVTAVGHRVVHGGAVFLAPVLLDAASEQRIEQLAELAPLHNAAALDGIRRARAALPDRPHVAVFDTAFHATMRPEASTYALPRRLREEHGVRRYGFHGLAVRSVAERVPAVSLVVCHLGGGASVTAVRNGRSVDTSMGFTPLEGVPMATRSGSVDPGAVLHLLRSGMSADELDHALEHESGLLGLSGLSDDVRELEAATAPEAAAALAHYAYRIATTVGAMAVALGGLDALAFSGGVGEHSWRVRTAVCAHLAVLGVALDDERNRTPAGDGEISPAWAHPRVVVVAAREEVVIAREVRAVTG